jgi:hypothetical protein
VARRAAGLMFIFGRNSKKRDPASGTNFLSRVFGSKANSGGKRSSKAGASSQGPSSNGGGGGARTAAAETHTEPTKPTEPTEAERMHRDLEAFINQLCDAPSIAGQGESGLLEPSLADQSGEGEGRSEPCLVPSPIDEITVLNLVATFCRRRSVQCVPSAHARRASARRLLPPTLCVCVSERERERREREMDGGEGGGGRRLSPP